MSFRRGDKQDFVITWISVSLAIAGLALNLFLLTRHFGSGGIAGCGGGNCAEILASRWAYVFRVPVTAFGAIAYLALLLSFRRGFESWRTPAVGLITGAAVWFVFVQTAILHRLCPWCLAAHGIALSLCVLHLVRMSRRKKSMAALFPFGSWLVAGIIAIGLVQSFGPKPVTHRLASDPDARTGENRGGPDTLPLLGSATAKHVMVEYFDYQCAACRTMAGHLAALIARHPEDLAVRLAPVPMDHGCNPQVPPGAHHQGSCAIAKTAFAVWYHSPERFAEFHREVLAEPSPDNARRVALELMAPDQLDGLTGSQRVFDAIQTNIAGWRKLSLETPKLPKLLVRPGRILHGLPSSEESFIEVMESELGL